MSNGFVHSVKVPRFYKVTAKTVQTVQEEGASLKQLIYEKQHPNLRGTYALAVTTIQHGSELDQLLRKSQLLFKEPRLDPWLSRVLITELLWGKKVLPTDAKPIKTILSYEKVLREELKKLDKTDVEADVNSKKVQKPRYVRINTLVKSVEDAIRSFTDDGWTLLPKSRKYSAFLKALANLAEGTFIQDYHIPELFAFPPGTHFHDHPGYKGGAIVLQDKASCLPAYLLNPPVGSSVLDMCSAPGMKTTHLAAIMKNKGKIIAVERDSRRFKVLCEMVQTNAATSVTTTINADAMKLDPKRCSDVEYILVDPSCSGSGMLDRISFGKVDPKCAPGRLVSLQSFQVLLLRHALLNFPTVKRVVYSTCSVYPEENEMVVDEILENVGDAYNLVPIKDLIGHDWKNFSSTDYKCKDKCLYANPDVDMCNGFFVAIFERNFDVPLPEYKRKEAAENPTNTKKKRQRNGSNDASDNGLEIAKTEEESVAGNERKSKTRKTECHGIADETLVEGEPPKKIKKKKKKNKVIEEAKAESIDDVQVDCAMNSDETLVEKKKKRKKDKRQNEEVFTDVHESLLESMPVNEEQEIKENKKKKKMKQSEVETVTEVISVSEILDNEEKSKKKKKKKLAEVEILDEVIPTVEISDAQKGKKIKKKKKEDNREA